MVLVSAIALTPTYSAMSMSNLFWAALTKYLVPDILSMTAEVVTPPPPEPPPPDVDTNSTFLPRASETAADMVSIGVAMMGRHDEEVDLFFSKESMGNERLTISNDRKEVVNKIERLDRDDAGFPRSGDSNIVAMIL
jgi:hypothetical protein